MSGGKMEKKDNKIDIELITRHLSGEVSASENKELKRWLAENPENSKLLDQYTLVWKKLGRVESVAGIDLDAEWNVLESRMAEAEKVVSLQPGRIRSAGFYITRIAVAAMLAVVLTFTGIYTVNRFGYKTLATMNQPEELVLPDGSTVTLNHFSSLKYPRKFSGETRSVELEGEGFFEVESNPDNPFVINTRDVDIKVLGTSFNVNAYRGNTTVEVIVKTGEVSVTRHGEVPRTIILKPGSKGIYKKTEETLEITKEINRNYLAWKTKSFVFEDQTLLDVSRQLYKVYRAEIIIDSDSLKDARITTTFNDQSLDAILNVLSATLDLDVRKSNGQIILSETN
jgi:ferric-dicitrate binding protein FerR (iron transport regulator)